MLIGISQNFQTLLGRLKYYLLERYHVQTVQIGMSIVCLLLSATATLLLYQRPILAAIVVALFAGIGAVLLVYNNMEKTLILFVMVSTALNLGVGTGTGTPITLTLMLLLLMIGLWSFRVFIQERSAATLAPTPANIPILLFGIVVIISMWWSTYYVEPDLRYAFADKFNPRMMTALVLIISSITPLLFGSFIRRESTLKFIVAWFVGYGLVSVAILVGIPSIFPHNVFNIRGQFPAWVVLLAAGQILFNTKLPNYMRLLTLAAAGGWSYVQFVLGLSWVSGWLPIVAGVGIIGLIYSRKLVFIGLIGVVIFGLLNIDTINTMLEAENEESGETRLDAGEHTFKILGQHFLFGTGPAGYYFYLNGESHLSHNNYLDIVSQTGVVGFALYIAIWLGLGWMCWKALQTSPPGTFLYGLAASLIGCWFVTMLSMALGDWVTPFPYTQGLAGISYTIWHWMMPGLAIAIYLINTRTPANEPDIKSSEPTIS